MCRNHGSQIPTVFTKQIRQLRGAQWCTLWSCCVTGWLFVSMCDRILRCTITTVSTVEIYELHHVCRKRWNMVLCCKNGLLKEQYLVACAKQFLEYLSSFVGLLWWWVDSGRLLFEDGEPLTFGDFMRGILTLRGSNQTTVKDTLGYTCTHTKSNEVRMVFGTEINRLDKDWTKTHYVLIIHKFNE